MVEGALAERPTVPGWDERDGEDERDDIDGFVEVGPRRGGSGSPCHVAVAGVEDERQPTDDDRRRRGRRR